MKTVFPKMFHCPEVKLGHRTATPSKSLGVASARIFVRSLIPERHDYFTGTYPPAWHPSFVPSYAACRWWRGWYGRWWRRMEERYHHVMQPHHRLRPDQPAVYCLASRDIDPSGVRTRNPEPPDSESERV